MSPAGTLTTFTVAYAIGAGFSRGVVLNALTLSSAGAVVGILAWASFTDRVVLGQSVIHAAYYGPLAALMSEIFSTRSRYTGASIGYQVAGMGAGFSPLIFASMQKAGAGTLTMSTVMAAFCLLRIACVVTLGETSKREMMEPAPVRVG